MKQTNKQTVFFQDMVGDWYMNQIDLKDVYTNVHSGGTKYGSSADMLVSEMASNLLELISLNKITLTKGLVITDYGCGKSKAANVVGKVFGINADAISAMMMQNSMAEVMDFLMPLLKAENAIKAKLPAQIEVYGKITVQRFDIGIKAFSKPLKGVADVVFCNDVFEHIPEVDLPAFICDLEAAGKYVFASISLRDAVNYSPLPERLVFKGAQKVEMPPKGAIILKQDKDDNFIFSLHVSVFSKAKWRKLLGKKWYLLPAQDYTACSAVNFKPSADYQAYKKDLISKVGFADFISFPTPVGTRYESDPILFRRVVMMQPSKHIMKLQTLKEYPESAFKASEKAKSEAFLKFIGLKPDVDGYYRLSKVPKSFVKKLYTLERLSKYAVLFERTAADANQIVANMAAELIAEYNGGFTDDFE